MSEIRIEGNIAYITLTKGYEAVIDAADVPLVEGYSWTAHVRKHGAVYVIAKKQVGGKRVSYLLHRVIMGPPADMTIDHQDRNPLNNRRYNLHIVTQAVNNENKATEPKGGVVFHRQRSKWQARVDFNGKRIYLGSFRTREQAQVVWESWWRTASEQVG